MAASPNRQERRRSTPYAFEPLPSGGFSVTATASSGSSSRTAIPAAAGPERVELVLVRNLSATVTAHVAIWNSTVVASTSDLSIAPGEAMVLSIPENASHFAAITRSGSADLQVSAGWGI